MWPFSFHSLQNPPEGLKIYFFQLEYWNFFSFFNPSFQPLNRVDGWWRICLFPQDLYFLLAIWIGLVDRFPFWFMVVGDRFLLLPRSSLALFQAWVTLTFSPRFPSQYFFLSILTAALTCLAFVLNSRSKVGFPLAEASSCKAFLSAIRHLVSWQSWGRKCFLTWKVLKGAWQSRISEKPFSNSSAASSIFSLAITELLILLLWMSVRKLPVQKFL